VLNAAGALVVAGKAKTLRDGRGDGRRRARFSGKVAGSKA
jgi:hypothetical protein